MILVWLKRIAIAVVLVVVATWIVKNQAQFGQFMTTAGGWIKTFVSAIFIIGKDIASWLSSL